MPKPKPRRELSDIAASRLRAGPADYMVRAGRNIFLRVRMNGIKTIVYRFKRDGKVREVKLGDYRSRGVAREASEAVVLITLEEARRRAAEMHAQRRDPHKPVDPATAQARRKSAAMTVADLHVEYLRWRLADTKSKRKIRRPEWFAWLFNTYVKPKLGDVAIRDLDKGMVHKALDKIVLRGAPISANRAMLHLRAMLEYARKRDYIERNPLWDMKRADVGGKEEARERVLSLDEMRALWHDTGARDPPSVSWQVRLAVRLLLLTGTRVGETLLAEWEHIVLDKGVWSIPKQNTKALRALAIGRHVFGTLVLLDKLGGPML